LGSLHDQVPPHSWEWTQTLLESRCRELGLALALDSTIIGSGCVAQVYRGLLLDVDADTSAGLTLMSESGSYDCNALHRSCPKGGNDESQHKYVAVKVRHPKIVEMIHHDLAIMYVTACVLDALPTMHWLSMPEEVLEFDSLMRAQLDFCIEARNLDRFHRNFKGNGDVAFPRPYFATDDVLIEEFMQGSSYSQRKFNAKIGVPVATFIRNHDASFNKSIADILMQAFFQMTLIDNFIHADLVR
jgi:aarF domain-containing kinase